MESRIHMTGDAHALSCSAAAVALTELSRRSLLREPILRSQYLYGVCHEQLSIPVDRGVSGDLRFGVLIAV